MNLKKIWNRLFKAEVKTQTFQIEAPKPSPTVRVIRRGSVKMKHRGQFSPIKPINLGNGIMVRSAEFTRW